MRVLNVFSDLLDVSIHFIFSSFLSSCFLLPYTFYFLDVVDNKPAHSAEELGLLAKKNSSAGYEPNDYVLTEAYVEFNQESVTEQRFFEDFDYDDISIGQTFFNAYRGQVDHFERKSLSSCLSSSMSHDGIGTPVVCRDKTHASGTEIQKQNFESEQIRTLLDLQREQILADCQAEIRKHEFQVDYDRRSIQKFAWSDQHWLIRETCW